jgi:Tfp pilus assembly protein PilF
MRSACSRVFAILVAIVFAVPAYAQLGSIAGKVIDKDGKPISGATVTMDRPEVGLHTEVKTDKNGIYIKVGIDDGTYKVTVIRDGETLASADVVVSLGFRVDKNFDLRSTPQGPVVAPVAMSKTQKEAEQKANSETQGAFNAGVKALDARNYPEALKQFTLALERRPGLAAIHARLGETYVATQKYSEGVDAYKKATELGGNEADYFYNLGLAAVRVSQFDLAKTSIQKSVELDAARAGLAFQNLGILLGSKSQDKDAVDALQKSIKANPKGADAYYQLGLIQMKSQDSMAESVAQFEKYLQLSPKGENAATAKQLVDAVKASAPKK